MNRERVAELRDQLLALDKFGQSSRFNMGSWFTVPNPDDDDDSFDFESLAEVEREAPRAVSRRPDQCGTGACLAGWAQILWAKTEEEKQLEAVEFAQEALRLDDIQAHHWFYGYWAETTLPRITLGMAVAFLTDQLEQPS